MTRFTLVAIAALTAACTTSAGLDARMDRELGANDGAFMRGDLPEVDAFDDTVSSAWIDVGGGYSYVEMHVEGEYGWAMVALDIWNGELGVGDLAPGNTVTFSGIGNGSSDDPDGAAIGCSGPAMGEAWFDEPADEVEVSVDEDRETGDIVVTVTANYGDNGSVFAVTPIDHGVRAY